jgi:hypothetical protein
MKQIPSWAINIHSYSQETFTLIEPESALLRSQEPATGPYPQPGECSQQVTTLFP